MESSFDCDSVCSGVMSYPEEEEKVPSVTSSIVDSDKASIMPNDAFYFEEDPMAVFLVENELFRVHCYYFIQGSEFFRNLFTQAGGRGDDSATAARSDEQQIPLSDVTVLEFTTLLRFFYAMAKRTNTTITGFDLLNLNMDEKLALLSISHRFMFDNIFEYMLRVVRPEHLSVLDRIRLGDKYDLSEWLLSAYEALIDRNLPGFTKEEIDLLGEDRVIRLFEAKVFFVQERLKTQCFNCNRTSHSMTTAKGVAVRYFAKATNNLPGFPATEIAGPRVGRIIWDGI